MNYNRAINPIDTVTPSLWRGAGGEVLKGSSLVEGRMRWINKKPFLKLSVTMLLALMPLDSEFHMNKLTEICKLWSEETDDKGA